MLYALADELDAMLDVTIVYPALGKTDAASWRPSKRLAIAEP